MSDSGDHYRVHVRCKTWRCNHCGKINLDLAQRRIEAGVEAWSAANDVTGVLITLTWDPAIVPDWDWTQISVHKKANAQLNHLQLTLQRAFGFDVVARVAANEPHKNGRLHGHAYLIIRGLSDGIPKCDPHTRGGLNSQRKRRGEPPIPKGQCYCPDDEPCAQKIAHRLGIGWVNLRYETGSQHSRHRLATYPAKYCAKSIGQGDWPRYAHRVRFSRSFSPFTAAEMRQMFADEARERLRSADRDVMRPEDLQFRPLWFWGNYTQDLDGTIWHRDELTEVIPVEATENRGPPFGASRETS